MRSRALGTLLFILALACALWLRPDGERHAVAPVAPVASGATDGASPKPLLAPLEEPIVPRRAEAEPSTDSAAPSRGAASGHEVALRVVDASGAPLVGARVVLFEEPFPSWTARPEEATDESGMARFARRGAGPYHYAVRHAGHAATRLGPLTTLGTHELVLQPAAALRVRLVDELDSSAIDGVEVLLAPESFATLAQGEAALETTKGGECDFESLLPGKYRLHASTPARWIPVSMELHIGPGRAEQELRARRGRLARGHVVDEDGDYVAEASIVLAPRDRRHPVTDGYGRFELAVGGVGELVRVEHHDHPAVEVQVPHLAFAPLEAGEAPRWRIALESAAAASFRVVDASGRARPGARATIHERGATRGREAHVDSSGMLTAYRLRRGVEHVVVVRAPGCATLVRAFESPREPHRHLGDLVLDTRPARLTVLVRAKSGAPLADARVDLQEAASLDVSSLAGWRRSATSNHAGIVVFEDLAAGGTIVEAWPLNSHAPCSAKFELAAGEDRRLELVAEHGGALRGFVVGADGVPIAQAEVFVTPAEEHLDWPRASTSTAADGTWVVDGLREGGDHHIHVSPPTPAADGREATRKAWRGGVFGPMRPGPETIRVELEPLPWRVLAFVDAAGNPLADLEVRVAPPPIEDDSEANDPARPRALAVVSAPDGTARVAWPDDTPMVVEPRGRAAQTLSWSAAQERIVVRLP